ncbi:phospholipase, patatin family protein [Hyaloscypha variabilis F]|uniref:Phospholipase, patatin family protein n=1 Tax=Hyaloscypha variabilis (strain UAMH 11265 / GT02V1 / F) TaxID=1149755 RepID=A0A2J6R3I9_HYAVF|nr:phospholipase, patatin family protein [Hyaloscypha variabilis F]
MSGEERPLRLLSLDGGGVRGLSSLIILQHLMRTINLAHPPKPCDYFDLIGGTSTGGLIAIMLGRLKMDIDECITAYLEISRDVFQPKKKRYNVFGRASDAIKVRGRFDSEALKSGIQKIVVRAGEDRNAKLRIENEPKCRVFVCAIHGEMGMHTSLLRGYESKQVQEDDCTIWEAGRATSAASSFFDPILIGQFQKTFVDGGAGCNNPVEKVYEEALNIWGQGATKRIQCIVSVGTGQPAEKAFGSGVKEIASTIIRIATETEQTAVRFTRLVAPILGPSPGSQKVYYRFNVIKGLEDVGLERHENKARIAAATRVYLNHPDTSINIDSCASAMRGQSR